MAPGPLYWNITFSSTRPFNVFVYIKCEIQLNITLIEVFFVIEGKMKIEFRDKTVLLEEGEMYVVPKGVDHKPFADEECKIMLVEPKGVVNTGDTTSDLTSENDVWL